MAVRPVSCILTPVCLGLVALAACSDAAPENREPVRVILVAPDAAALGRMIASETGAGLVGFGPDGQVVPRLARSWNVSPDGRAYLFRLRPDLRWDDGAEMQAPDVRAALDRAVGSARKGLLRPLLGSIESIAAPAPNTIEIRLAAPMPNLLQLLALPELGVRQARRSAPGMLMVQGAMQAPLTLVPGPSEPSRPPGPRVMLSALPRDVGLARFAQARAEVVTGATIGGYFAARDVGARSGALRLEPAAGYLLIVFGRDMGALADERLRAALSLVIDREGLASRLFAIALVRGQLSLTPATAAGPAGVIAPDWANLPIEARQRAGVILATEAGVSLEQPLTLTIDAPDEPEYRAILQLLSNSWAPLGITLRGRLRDPARHAAFVASGAYQLAITERIAPVPVAAPFLEPLKCAKDLPALCDPQADAAWDRYQAGGDPDERAAAERAWLQKTAAIPLFTSIRWSLVSPAVSGWQDNPVGVHPLWALDRR